VWPERDRVVKSGRVESLRVEHEGFVVISAVGRVLVRPADRGLR
jgi:hypothetical protein